MQWSKGIVELSLNGNRVAYKQAILCDGLAVHHHYDNEVKWQVTHAVSGLTAGPYSVFNDKQSAITYAEKLLMMEGFWLLSLAEMQLLLQRDGIHRQRLQEVCSLHHLPTGIGREAMAVMAMSV